MSNSHDFKTTQTLDGIRWNRTDDILIERRCARAAHSSDPARLPPDRILLPNDPSEWLVLQ